MYYIEKNKKIVLYNSNLQNLQATIAFLPQYQNLKIKETDRQIINFEWADTDEYKASELEKVKKAKITENDKLRDEALIHGVQYKDVLFDSDTDQKVNLLAIVSTMSDEDIITWFGKDNNPLVCTKEDLLNIGSLITQLHSFCWNKNAQIKAAINSAETLTALKKVVIDYENDTDCNE